MIGAPMSPSRTREDRFRDAPLYRDVRGYVWQRLRNGVWRSTDGLSAEEPRAHGQNVEASTFLPVRWAPYTRIVESAASAGG